MHILCILILSIPVSMMQYTSYSYYLYMRIQDMEELPYACTVHTRVLVVAGHVHGGHLNPSRATSRHLGSPAVPHFPNSVLIVSSSQSLGKFLM